MLERDPRSIAEKIRLFTTRFHGLEDVYGTYDPDSGRSWQVKDPITDEVALDHLIGRQPYGVYFLINTRTCALVVDYDTGEPGSPIEFVGRAAHYGIESYIEVSKSKGFHVWIFFPPEGVSAAKARAVVKHILAEAGQRPEVFPKQDRIDLSRGEYGNFVNLPLFGRLVAEGRSVFVEPKNGLRPAPNQWEYIEQMKSVPESVLDDAIEANEIVVGSVDVRGKSHTLGVFKAPWTLPPCAKRMLNEGVSEYQRVSCFRLAVLLRRIGMPFDLVVATLMEWSAKNRPHPGKRVLSTDEIKAQTSSAYQKEYPGYGCEEPAVQAFCDPSCPILLRKHAGKGEKTAVPDCAGTMR